VPPGLVERPKMGFSVPLASWLRGELRDWAEGLLSKTRLAADGIFAADEVRRLWDQHQARQADRAQVLWNVLMFQAWKEHYHV
jgi:asparagine synthase (glutamine-hydrolysing)